MTRFFRLSLFAAAALASMLQFTGTASAQYPLTSGTLTLGDGRSASEPLEPGESVELAGGGFEPGAEVEIWLHSDPMQIATIKASQAGAIDVNVEIPADAPAGRHTLQARGAAPGGGTVILKAPIVVAASTAAAERNAPAAERNAPADERNAPADAEAATAQPTKATETEGGTLPFTGLPLFGVVLAGVALLALGGVLSVLARR